MTPPISCPSPKPIRHGFHWFRYATFAHDGNTRANPEDEHRPTAEWTARQIAEAFPWDSAPRYLLHDHDCICGGRCFVSKPHGLLFFEIE
jgi:hypothetical protein